MALGTNVGCYSDLVNRNVRKPLYLIIPNSNSGNYRDLNMIKKRQIRSGYPLEIHLIAFIEHLVI
jgi:hypothetical protein